MIRLRDSEGKAYEVGKDIRFVEICNAGGELAGLIRCTGRGVACLHPGDVEFENYSTAFRSRKAVVLIESSKSDHLRRR